MNEIRCYFCNQILRNETVEQHSAQCGYVLEPCVNKCGAYIQRHSKTNHLQVCRNTRLKSAKSTESLLSASGYDTYPRGNQNNFVRTGTLPRSYKHPSQTQLQKSGSYYFEYPQPPSTPQPVQKMAPQSTAMLDDLSYKFQYSHQKHSDLIRQIEFAVTKLRSDVQVMQSQNKAIVEWRTNVQYQLDSIVNSIAANNKNDINTHRLQELTKDLSQLRNTLNGQQVTLKTEQIDTRQFRNDLEQQFLDFEKFCKQQLQQLVMVNGEQKLQIQTLIKDNADYRVANRELSGEIDGLKKEILNLKSDCTNMAEREKLQGAQIADLKRSLAQINLNVEVAERSFENIQGLIATKPGRIVWKIADFKLKMENAKTNEKIPIKSPVFYTGDYGYRVRLQVHLNGLKKWRGRHMLACLHVMKGDYDDLLIWPCRIEANIILRDLESGEKAKDFVRYITAKRNYPEDVADDPQESSTQYIFIPHTTLLKSSHLKNDAVFLEIVINNA